MAEINHSIGAKVPLESAFQAISTPKGISRWWTTDVRGKAAVGGILEIWFEDFVTKLEVLESEAPKRVCWKCTEGPEEWIGTEISFELEEDEGQCLVYFRHSSWKSVNPMLSLCSTKWAVFLLSLKDYLET